MAVAVVLQKVAAKGRVSVWYVSAPSSGDCGKHTETQTDIVRVCRSFLNEEESEYRFGEVEEGFLWKLWVGSKRHGQRVCVLKSLVN